MFRYDLLKLTKRLVNGLAADESSPGPGAAQRVRDARRQAIRLHREIQAEPVQEDVEITGDLARYRNTLTNRQLSRMDKIEQKSLLKILSD